MSGAAGGTAVEAGIALALVLAVLLGWARLGWWQWRAETRSAPWRVAALLALQPVAAALLYLTLLPPRAGGGGERLVIATAGAPTLAGADAQVIALPEAGEVAGAERQPDLATALRRHPGTRALRIVGGGLAPRDRAAAATLPLSFSPGPAPRGLIGLYPPGRVAPGAAFVVGARVRGGAAELVDPAGRVVDRVTPGTDGLATLGGVARGGGATLFTVRVRDAGGAVAETASVPVVVAAAAPTRLLIVAGAPSPEIKYLHRWAVDAGLAPLVRAGLGGGAGLDAGPLTPARLEQIDAVVVDERGWASLPVGERRAVIAAVRGGLGLVARVTGPVPAAVRAEWRTLGLDPVGGQAGAGVALAPTAPTETALEARRGPGSGEVPAAAAGTREDLPALTRRVVAAPGLVPLLRDARGAMLAGWRGAGAGRVALWTVEDSFALVTAGHGDRHAEWWSAILSAVARPDRATALRLPALARVGERAIICGLAGEGTASGAGQRAVRLLPDPAAGGCAGFWPAQAGWYRIDSGRRVAQSLYVHPIGALPGVVAEERREATLALVGDAAPAPRDAAPGARGAAWPWFLGWLAVAALLWWLERARTGRPRG